MYTSCQCSSVQFVEEEKKKPEKDRFGRAEVDGERAGEMDGDLDGTAKGGRRWSRERDDSL
jgi:hypothetical protein